MDKYLPKNFLACYQELEQKVSKNYFTAWSFANQNGCMSGAYLDEYNTSNISKTVDNLHPYFDLSSVSKPLFLNLYLRLYWKKPQYFLDAVSGPIQNLYKDFTPSKKADPLFLFFQKKENKKLTLDHLLSHTSGAKNWFWMGYALKQGKEEERNIVTAALQKFTQELGTTTYSDINYYLLARIIEQVQEKFSWKEVLKTINTAAQSNFFHASLEPEKTKYSVPFYPYRIVPKKVDSDIYINDVNADILAHQKIVSGHTGFFGSVLDVIQGVKVLAKHQAQLLPFLPAGKYKDHFILGLDTPTTPDSTSGIKNWKNKKRVFGHLGFTGTSFWFYNGAAQTEKSQFHVLLTNRTAQRTSKNLSPRIFIYQDFKKKTVDYFLQDKHKITKISAEEVKKSFKKYSTQVAKVWDPTVLRIEPNMSTLRRFIGATLWDI